MAQKIIDVDASKPIQSTVAELQLSPRALIILLSNFDSRLNDEVGSICSRVIIPAALEPGALILDDASYSGCAGLLGQAALDQDKMTALLGVVPNSRADSDIDGSHELILRLPAAWSDVAKYTFQIADELVRDGAVAKPALAVLFGGAEAEKKSLIRCARRGWPVLVVQGSGGLADQLLDALSAGANGNRTASLMDPALREIVETATIHPSLIGASADNLSRILLSRIDAQRETANGTLRQAWMRFDELDATALAKQARFRTVETALLALGVSAAFFAILTTRNAVPLVMRLWLHRQGVPAGTLHGLVLLTPITISVIGAYNSHFRDGTKWILLRDAAEALKREIFRFRAQAGAYSDEECLQTSRELKLAAKIRDITTGLEQSEVNKTNLLSRQTDVVPQGGTAGRTTPLSADEYLEMRLRNQVKHFSGKTGRLALQLRLLQLLIYVAGAAGTVLAAIRLDIWVAIATALVTAFTTKLQAEQVENSLMQYNQALTGLRNIDAWWNALSKWEKGRRQNIDVLVDQTEKTLESESVSWVQQMQAGLDKLTEKEPHRWA